MIKTRNNTLLAATTVLVALALIDGGSRSTRAETGAGALNDNSKNEPRRSDPARETRDLVITRVFDAPVEQVWEAWTDPEYVMRWWGPTGFTACECKIDFRVGGKYVFCMRAPKEFQGGQAFYTAGVYKKIVPLTLIEYSQALSDKDGKRVDPTTIGMPADFAKEIPSALAFKRVGRKTELTVTEYGWAVGQMREMSEAGMNQCLDKLAEALAKHK